MPGGKSSNVGGGYSTPINVRRPAQLRQRVWLGIGGYSPSNPVNPVTPPLVLLNMSRHALPSTHIDFVPKEIERRPPIPPIP